MLLWAAQVPAVTSHHFTANEVWTLSIAAYAAFISTFLLGWDVYKWLTSGAKVDLSASAGMKIMGGPAPDPQTYISITAMNVGDRPTTITNLAATYFESWWMAYVIRRKATQNFVITSPSQTQPIPYRFEVGDQWIGMAIQSKEIVRMAQNGYLFFILFTARSGHGHRIRVKVSPSDTQLLAED